MAAKRPVKRSLAWLAEEGEKFKNAVLGQTNYVGGRVPFPMNPTFRPNQPLKDATRREIYSRWKQDPKLWTPRQISASYGISIKRAEAIIKLKALEARMVGEGFVPQRNYVAGMEQMLAAQAKPVIRENLREVVPQIGKPRYVAIDEESTFDAEDAAKRLSRASYAEVREAIEQSDNVPLHPKQLDTNAPKERVSYKVLARNSRLGNKRWQFMVTDVNRKVALEDRSILVRDRSGILREATDAERLRRAHSMNWA
ncbi:eukaryotic mitochondrial regulator protein-domain-containing protein [Thamnocephalis sphaerospora]|uniref:Eukaryotic mitochondrial regulator protein-domain-containing protein n=1 Tax=Thamnocephalis sphaerospora TaxID=78915 RepID=A0A4P9XX86_9FUNG|nr:eukaryotic mitochondrial regulator protein-domain-containing protein [Thamnocephalis sphaerospora]|eukprot:RKP10907.1 eukaryotic mitochondrial regulator protein-domain-containing protein [Thamnocephalis sphaerospora]